MKKLLGLVLSLVLMLNLFSFAAVAETISKEDIKIGFIYIGDENEGYTFAHYDAAMKMKEALGLSDDQLIFKMNTPETEAAYDSAVDHAEQGCNIIFANSFGFESYIVMAASEYPEIQFCHASGVQASASGLTNMHNYFTAIHEGRYVSGVVAGLKLNEMIDNGTITADTAKIGYVGAFPFAEVVSGYTAFFLGARSICPSVTMDVRYTNSWSDASLEKETAEALIAGGAVLIGQHSDTTGPSVACEAKNVPIVGYNISMIPTAPNYALTSAAANWAPFVTYAVESVLNGTTIETDWCQGYVEGAVGITELNEKAVAKGTQEKVDEVIATLVDGTFKVFDTATFTVNGETTTSYNTVYGFEGNEMIGDGHFREAELRSAPCFELRIDGITELTEN